MRKKYRMRIIRENSNALERNKSIKILLVVIFWIWSCVQGDSEILKIDRMRIIWENICGEVIQRKYIQWENLTVELLTYLQYGFLYWQKYFGFLYIRGKFKGERKYRIQTIRKNVYSDDQKKIYC